MFCDILDFLSFLPSYLQLLKLVSHNEESTTMKYCLNSLTHSLIKVVYLNKHFLLELNLVLLIHHLGKVLHEVKIFKLLDLQFWY